MCIPAIPRPRADRTHEDVRLKFCGIDYCLFHLRIGAALLAPIQAEERTIKHTVEDFALLLRCLARGIVRVPAIHRADINVFAVFLRDFAQCRFVHVFSHVQHLQVLLPSDFGFGNRKTKKYGRDFSRPFSVFNAPASQREKTTSTRRAPAEPLPRPSRHACDCRASDLPLPLRARQHPLPPFFVFAILCREEKPLPVHLNAHAVFRHARILAVGLAAYEWNIGGVNEKQDQLEKFTSNCIGYLK